jgi:hypothetical protein
MQLPGTFPIHSSHAGEIQLGWRRLFPLACGCAALAAPLRAMDFYRLIKICGMLTGLWLVQFASLRHFQQNHRKEPPRYVVVDFEKWLASIAPDQPVVDLAAAQGLDLSVPWVSPDAAREIDRKHHRSIALAWSALALGLSAAGITLWISHRLWGNWLLGIPAVILGPIGIAWTVKKGYEHQDCTSLS